MQKSESQVGLAVSLKGGKEKLTFYIEMIFHLFMQTVNIACKAVSSVILQSAFFKGWLYCKWSLLLPQRSQ